MTITKYKPVNLIKIEREALFKTVPATATEDAYEIPVCNMRDAHDPRNPVTPDEKTALQAIGPAAFKNKIVAKDDVFLYVPVRKQGTAQNISQLMFDPYSGEEEVYIEAGKNPGLKLYTLNQYLQYHKIDLFQQILQGYLDSPRYSDVKHLISDAIKKLEKIKNNLRDLDNQYTNEYMDYRLHKIAKQYGQEGPYFAFQTGWGQPDSSCNPDLTKKIAHQEHVKNYFLFRASKNPAFKEYYLACVKKGILPVDTSRYLGEAYDNSYGRLIFAIGYALLEAHNKKLRADFVNKSFINKLKLNFNKDTPIEGIIHPYFDVNQIANYDHYVKALTRYNAVVSAQQKPKITAKVAAAEELDIYDEHRPDLRVGNSDKQFVNQAPVLSENNYGLEFGNEHAGDDFGSSSHPILGASARDNNVYPNRAASYAANPSTPYPFPSKRAATHQFSSFGKPTPGQYDVVEDGKMFAKTIEGLLLDAELIKGLVENFNRNFSKSSKNQSSKYVARFEANENKATKQLGKVIVEERQVKNAELSSESSFTVFTDHIEVETGAVPDALRLAARALLEPLEEDLKSINVTAGSQVSTREVFSFVQAIIEEGGVPCILDATMRTMIINKLNSHTILRTKLLERIDKLAPGLRDENAVIQDMLNNLSRKPNPYASNRAISFQQLNTGLDKPSNLDENIFGSSWQENGLGY